MWPILYQHILNELPKANRESESLARWHAQEIGDCDLLAKVS